MSGCESDEPEVKSIAALPEDQGWICSHVEPHNCLLTPVLGDPMSSSDLCENQA